MALTIEIRQHFYKWGASFPHTYELDVLILEEYKIIYGQRRFHLVKLLILKLLKGLLRFYSSSSVIIYIFVSKIPDPRYYQYINVSASVVDDVAVDAALLHPLFRGPCGVNFLHCA